MKSYKNFILEKKKLDMLRYYLFDWDDNILKMHTLLHFKKRVNGEWFDVDITPEEFAQIRKKYEYNYMDNPEWKGDINKTFIEFRDFGPRGKNAFIKDIETSINMGNFGPSWKTFINCLIGGNLFAIITTRGHEPTTLKSAVKWIIYNYLSDNQINKMKENLKDFNKIFGEEVTDDKLIEDYLNKCYFIGLFSEAFQKQYGFVPSGKDLNRGKQEAIKYFVNYVRDYAKYINLPLKVGFSDDDVKFSGAARELFMGMEKSLDFMEDFYVFDTSDPKVQGGVKIKID